MFFGTCALGFVPQHCFFGGEMIASALKPHITMAFPKVFLFFAYEATKLCPFQPLLVPLTHYFWKRSVFWEGYTLILATEAFSIWASLTL